MTTERIDRGGVGLRSERGPILLAVMLSTGLEGGRPSRPESGSSLLPKRR